MNPISPLIHLVDDDASVREALALLIGTVGLRVAPWADPQDFLARFDRDAVGAIVLDMRMPGLSGLALIDELRAQGVDQPVVMLTGHGSVDMCRRAFKAGAAEFLEKPVDDEALLGAVQAAVRTHLALRRQDAAGREARQRHALLSAREREVLALVIKGQTSKEIARALQLSPRTVETHRAHLQDKLQVQTLAQLVRQYAALVDEGAA
ncbi:MAG TPA: response regulator [Ottowia sp.]|nr:response regulator [Ottowia sp.]